VFGFVLGWAGNWVGTLELRGKGNFKFGMRVLKKYQIMAWDRGILGVQGACAGFGPWFWFISWSLME
jgi:hypothetical protein